MVSPGDSSVPANREPIMMTSAPAATAFGRSPEYFTPPSAMTGTPYFLAIPAQLLMAVICGTPTPATTLVVQMEPGPMPTLMASAPASIRARAPAAVATLPATSWQALLRRFTAATAETTPAEWPWAVSM